MRVILGRYMDGGAWPDAFHLVDAARNTTSEGIKICGPAGFLSMMEEKLGLPVADTHAGVRIAAWESAMAARIAERDAGDLFYAASFTADSWSTARYVLSMRDELMLLGVIDKAAKETAALPPRISEICLLDGRLRRSAGESDVPGYADRFRQMLNLIRNGWPVPSASLSVELVGSRALWDRPWRELFEELEKRGVRVSERVLKKDDESSPEVCILTGETLAEAAEALASVLAVDKDDSGSIVIIRSEDSTELDSALRRRCGVSTGCRPSSSSRPAMHLLTLYLRLHLLPFDPEVLRQFLLLPLSPVDEDTAHAFLRALNRCESAVTCHSEFWPGAWKRELAVTEGLSPAVEAAGRWLFPEQRVEAEGIACENMERLASSLRNWAWSADIEGHAPELRSVADLCTRTMDAVRRKTGRMSRLEFEKLLDSLLGDGERLGYREAMPWAVLSDPGQLFGPADTVIWWDVSDPGTALRESVRWQHAELAWMGELAPEGPGAARTVQKLGWEAPFRYAQKRLVLVIPRMKRGEPAAEHPVLSARKLTEARMIDAAEVLGLTPSVESAKPWRLPAERVKPLPESVVWRPDAGHPCDLPGVIYPSTLERMLECPAAWYLENVLELKDSRFPLAPDSILRGNIAHDVVEKVLKGECPCTEEAMAGELLRSARKKAARLTSDTAASIRFDMARRLYRSITLLQKRMQELDLRFVNCEQTWMADMPLKGTVCRGSYDIALGPASGNGISHIVDLKWSKSKRYENAAKSGLCVQLLLYWYLLRFGAPVVQDGDSAERHHIENAWYLLLVSQSMVAGHEEGGSFESQWEHLNAQLGELAEAFGKGVFRLAGKEKKKTAPCCTYCSYRGICGVETAGECVADDEEKEQ